MLVIGVDPGLDGAMALLCSRRGLLDVVDLPTCPNGLETGSMKRWLDINGLGEALKDWGKRFEFLMDFSCAVIERPIAMPKLPAQTVASQFDTFGVLRVALHVIADTPVVFVQPREWQKMYGLKAGNKAASRETCLRLYPDAPVKLVKHHNRAESILIAHWRMRGMA